MLLGTEAQLAKVDVKAAYQLAPIHPDNWPLLSVEWKGKYYLDTRCLLD